MFGAPLRDFCLRDVEEKPVEGFVVKEPVAEESVVERFVVEESDTEGLDESAKAALKEACASIGYKPAQPENTVEEEPAQPEPEQPENTVKEEPPQPAQPENTVEEFGNCNSHNKEGFSNRVLFGQRFLSLDLALRAVLYALLFYIVAHNDTQGLLKGVVKRLPKVVKPFAPMLLFGVLYYVLNLFI